MRVVLAVWSLLALALPAAAAAAEPIRLASGPAVSPDGSTVVFTWAGDLWSVPSGGGAARRLSTASGLDSFAAFSPDGSEIAFSADRGAGRQIFVMPAGGGVPAPLTFDTAGFTVAGWFPDGGHLLAIGLSDRDWRHPWRFYRISRTERRAPEMLFDAYGGSPSVSPDGRRILFTREGVAWWRKGYRGSQASQIWLYDLDRGECREILREETGCRTPLWLPDGESFLYVGVSNGAFNLTEYDLRTGVRTPLTRFDDDSVVAPAVSADGTTVVFRHLFDLYRLRRGVDADPVRLDIGNPGEPAGREVERRNLDRATDVTFTPDGLEMALVAGGDLFVMDTVLREPVAVTATPGEEADPVFVDGGKALLFLSTVDGRTDVWRATRPDPKTYWWRSGSFVLERVTDDAAVERSLTVSPDGRRIAFVRGAGDLVTADLDGKHERVLLRAFDGPEYDWSPDSRWIAYAVDDDDFNRDVWIVAADGTSAPVNVSRHPDNEWNPTFSPDGRLLAFVGRRVDREADICYVWLARGDDEESRRDRTLAEAVEKMKKGRGAAEKSRADAAAEFVRIDFDRIASRVRRIPIPDTTESGLFWSPDGKRLAFEARIDGRHGTYAVTFPDDLSPKLLVSATGTRARWVREGDRIRWLVNGVPTSTTSSGRSESYGFRARQEVDVAGRYRAAFDDAWRTMRDEWYDPAMNGRDWGAIRGKYREVAAASPDRETFERVVELMLGELNGSHLGFSAFAEPPAGPKDDWAVETAHLGVRTDPGFSGPGLRIVSVLAGGPAEKAGLRVGETILAVDGKAVDAGMDPTLYLNGVPGREVAVRVRAAGADAAERTVRYVPGSARDMLPLLYDAWVDGNRRRVDELSGGRLGYVHVAGMNWSSFYEFEREIYDVGYGRDGLVIDVRENGGGFTADHLLTILTQPVHAFTVPRGGAAGYPQDRKVYATWTKPIVVLVNQGSFSNAEIFAHAVQTLRRGRLVGVPTAGGVISTGGHRVLDVGWLRTPGRGWFLPPDGEDMERNGAVPDILIWPEPGEMPRGIDRQLDAAVRVLLEDVAEEPARPAPRYASSRRDGGK